MFISEKTGIHTKYNILGKLHVTKKKQQRINYSHEIKTLIDKAKATFNHLQFETKYTNQETSQNRQREFSSLPYLSEF